jgi:hypothetical protein
VTSRCNHYEDDWELAALGSLDASELAEMEAHLQTGCDVCLARFREAQIAMSSIAALSPAEEPSASVERQLRLRIAGAAAPVRPRRPLVPWLLAAASVVMAAWLGWDRHVLLRQLAQEKPKTAPPIVVAPPASAPEKVIVRETVPVPVPVQVERIPPSVAAELDRLRETVAQLTASQTPPSSAETERLRARIAELEKEKREAAARPPAASPAVTAGTDSEAELAALRQQLERQQSEAQLYSRQLGELRGLLRVLQTSSLRQVELRPSDPSAKTASGRALITAEGAVVLLMQRLPPLASSKCYQLWLIKKGNPSIVSGGVLQTDSQGNGLLIGSGGTQLTGLAITEEPAGGSVSAQGHKLLFGVL